ncbi:hypothetical protein SpiGrapes_0117 [Sphaerochaeta pleomorpha str. Grapes]|uniref:Tetratricopeptide repeat protein n=1 Tax=Sphaerochaeta pleomorpha (strain ATCC BAA-1885 / DSM 22778 / Grapes) TaxID=158190 RepID=G8QTL6_SPHPG|nr:hypothetical protein [Sphaerochaeta pleomorpha]AEV27981.1 hypothetical protein SpiGrapes_0117 [Sphaerochaeta pleomorpha str. Grapes]
MRKTIAFVLLFVFLVLHTSAAQTVTDSYAFLQGIPLYSQLLEETKNTGNFEQAKQIRSEILAMPSSSLDATQRVVLEIKADTALARMCIEVEPKQIPYAKELLGEAETKAGTLGKDTLYSYCALADINGIWYLISSLNLSRGIASSKLIGKAYTNFPTETTAILLKANSMLYSPSISQNSIKEALSMFLEVLRQKKDSLAKWDLANVYSGIGIACYKLGDLGNASGYLKAAKALYGLDNMLDEYLAELEKTN